MIDSVLRTTLGAVLLASTTGIHAAAAPDTIAINGFLTAAASRASEDDVSYRNGLVNEDLRADIADTRFGIQIGATVDDRIDLTAQLIARGGDRDFDFEADWGFASYRVSDRLQVRAGKIKIPTFLVSDYIEVGFAYPWIRPPQAVYSLNAITTLVGGDLLLRTHLGGVDILVQPFLGNRSFTAVVPPALASANSIAPGTTADVEADNLLGINISATHGPATYRVGYLQTDVSSEFGAGFDDATARFFSAGLTIDWSGWVGYAEFVERDEDPELEDVFPDQRAWYATLGYRLGEFMPYLTYAELDSGADANPFALQQTSTTLGLRYELTTSADLKLEVEQVDPDRGNFGLFDQAVEDATLVMFALDVIF